ncbi:exopolyphosphatase PRUNE1 isoform X2 [Palaemon carinicauda]|uniref:exopolyphosphatase PRUNE1 isoform X2 n=1 Tax=Palaemon carinicauda TaxID=392227 RepID=UPI0035B60700
MISLLLRKLNFSQVVIKMSKFCNFLAEAKTTLGDDEENWAIVPSLNIQQEDYPLKTEVSYWLSKHGVTQEHIIFRNELDLAREKALDVKLTLVDHNVQAINDKDLEPLVVSILDHHKLERPNPENVRDGIRIEMVGSCSTLVAEEVLEKLPDILDNTTASLLYGTIILDTVNLNKEAKRVTAKDIEVCQHLQSRMNFEPNNNDIFKELTAAKSDVSNLTSEELLRKDVKVVEGCDLKIAIPSIPMSVKRYLEQPGVSETLKHHCAKHDYAVIVIMGITITEEKVSRDIAVYSVNDELKKKVTHHLQSASDGILQLEPMDISVECGLVYIQKNHAASRKVVLPLIREWLCQM